MSQDDYEHIYVGDNNEVTFQCRTSLKETCPSNSGHETLGDPKKTIPNNRGQVVKTTSNWNDEDSTKINGKFKVIFSIATMLFIAIFALLGVLLSWASRSNIQNNELKEMLIEETRKLESNLINSVTAAKLSLNQSEHDLMNIVADNKREADILRRGSRNCSELRDKHGITTAGYYMIRGNYYEATSYIYCDFKQYADVSTCSQLTSNYNIGNYGYYLLGSSTKFQYCPDVYTCHHLMHRDGITESGFYQVGTPDDQYRVYCNLFPGFAVTEILHNSMEEMQATRCSGAACYFHRPQYDISMEHMVKIITHSKQCQQYIKYRCKHSVLLDPMHGYWKSRDGEQMKYWGGASSKRPGYCGCGETGTCDNKLKKCNCDKNDFPITQDEGYLTDKSKLPVTEMRFGDIDDAAEAGWHTLGKLQCTGSA